MAETPKLTLEQAVQRIHALERLTAGQAATILKMQQVGGFADSKQLSTRSQRLEDRVQVLEFNDVLHQDVTAHQVELLKNHLLVRHGIAESDNGPDMIFLRKTLRRLREWAEDKGLMNKRRDVTGARNDENRLRPPAAQS